MSCSPSVSAALIYNINLCFLFLPPDCLKLLLKHGADPKALDKEGTKPVDLAKDDEARMLLLKASRHQDAQQSKSGTYSFYKPER